MLAVEISMLSLVYVKCKFIAKILYSLNNVKFMNCDKNYITFLRLQKLSKKL